MVWKIGAAEAYGTAHVFSLELAAVGLTVFGDNGEALGTFARWAKRLFFTKVKCRRLADTERRTLET